MKKFNLIGLLFGLLLLTVTVMDFLSGSVGLLLASVIVGGQYTDAMTHARRLLSAKMEKTTWWKSKWSPYIGLIDKDEFKKVGSHGSMSGIQPTGELIDMVKDFGHKGGIYMDVPIRYPLVAQPTFGSKKLLGSEEKRKVANKKVAINQVRHAVQIQDNKMSRQVLQNPVMRLDLMKRGSADLTDWFSRYLAVQPYYALLSGYSDNLTDTSYGVNMTEKSHPNFYLADAGQVTFNATPATYETNVATAVDVLGNKGAIPDTAFSTEIIRNMVYSARKHRIQPLKVGGNEYFLIFIHGAQARQLQNDEAWMNAQYDAAEKGKDNQIFTGKIEGRAYEGALFIIDDTIPSVYTTNYPSTEAPSKSYTYYGLSTYMANPRSVGNMKAAILCGAGAITAGYASPLAFSSEQDDYEQFLGDAADMIVGFERADIMDDDGYFGTAGAFLENNSSLVCVTYSPDTLTW
jgi:hypothetical protein